MNEKQLIWVLCIETKHGVDTTLWEEYEDAVEHLNAYVRDHWDDWCIEEYGPWDEANASDLVDRYIGDSCDETYWLSETYLNRSSNA